MSNPNLPTPDYSNIPPPPKRKTYSFKEAMDIINEGIVKYGGSDLDLNERDAVDTNIKWIESDDDTTNVWPIGEIDNDKLIPYLAIAILMLFALAMFIAELAERIDNF